MVVAEAEGSIREVRPVIPESPPPPRSEIPGLPPPDLLSENHRLLPVADRSIIVTQVQDHGKVFGFQSERRPTSHPDFSLTLVRILGSRNWDTCASRPKLALYNPKRAQRNPSLKAIPHTGIPLWQRARTKGAATPWHHHRGDEGTHRGCGRSGVFPFRLSLVGLVGEPFVQPSVRYAHIASSGYTAHTNCQTPLRCRVRAFDPLRAWVLVDTCRGHQQEERVCWPEISSFLSP